MAKILQRRNQPVWFGRIIHLKTIQMDGKARSSLDNDDACAGSIEDEKESGEATSRPSDTVNDMSSSQGKNIVSSSRPSDDSIQSDKRLIQEVLKRYTESLEAQRIGSMTGERKRRERSSMTSQGQLLDSDADSNRKKQKPPDIENPLDMDVLFGRRDAQRFHPGNVLLRALCDTYRNEYETGDREVKNVVKKRIIDEIGSKGGRFLKRQPGETTWYSVDEEVALEKVAFTMRDTRDKTKPYPG